MKYLVTGGAGFIGSAVIRKLIAETDHEVCNVDLLTYAGNLSTLAQVEDSPRYRFEKADIRDKAAMAGIIADFRPDVIMHLAAETHVDRSIDGPADFISTNLVGTYAMLEAALDYWRGLDADGRAAFRFQHISTDEVYGSLGADGAFTEDSVYAPNSPYAASKAGSDHLVRAWHKTYGLPVITTNCSNNYGPYQFPEKLIPLMIINALHGEKLPVYGDGAQVRDWLHVADHADALVLISERAAPGAVYNVGGDNERTNLETVQSICSVLDELRPRAEGAYADLVSFVDDRPGHDRRYAIDASRLKRDLGWQPGHTGDEGLRQTVAWYLENEDWWQEIRSTKYSGDRLGRGAPAKHGETHG